MADRLIRKRANGRMLAAAVLALIAVPFSYAGIVQPAGAAALCVAMLTVTFGVCNGYYGLVYASVQDIVLPAQRATAIAIYFFGMYILGASYGPVVTGRLSDIFARRAAEAAGSATVTETFRAVGLQQAMLVIPAISIVLAIVLWAGSRTIAKDMAHRERASSPVAAA